MGRGDTVAVNTERESHPISPELSPNDPLDNFRLVLRVGDDLYVPNGGLSAPHPLI